MIKLPLQKKKKQPIKVALFTFNFDVDLL